MESFKTHQLERFYDYDYLGYFSLRMCLITLFDYILYYI